MATGTSAGRGLAIVRIALGLYFLDSTFSKVTAGWLTSGATMAGTLSKQAEQSEGFYRTFLLDTVIPQADLFARLIVVGELATAFSLILGLLVPLGSLIGLALMANFILLKGLPALRDGTDWLVFLGFFGLLIGAAGMTWGLDGRIFGRRRADADTTPLPPRGPRRLDSLRV